MRSVIVNIFFQGLYQLVALVAPIITLHIAATALGSDGLGIYIYITAIAAYFTLFAGLGVGTYGIREIARNRDDKSSLSRTFWGIEALACFSTIIACAAFLVLAFMSTDTTFFLIALLTVVATMLNVDWFWAGIEDFRQIALVSAVMRITSVTAVALLVHNPSDLPVYFWVMCSTTLLTQLCQWPFLLRRVHVVKVCFHDILGHLKGAIRFFLISASISLYTTLNRVLLGALGTVALVAYYGNALTITGACVSVIGIIDTVLLPRLSHSAKHRNPDDLTRVTTIAIHTQLYITIPAALGMAVILPQFVPWFFGSEYGIITQIGAPLALLIVVMPLGISVARQYFTPNDQLRSFNISVIVAGALAIIINVILIPRIGIWGAVTATLAAETAVTVIRLSALIRQTKFSFHAGYLVKVLVSALIMAGVIFLTTRSLPDRPLTTLVQGLGGVILFGLLTLALRANPMAEFKLRARSSKGQTS